MSFLATLLGGGVAVALVEGITAIVNNILNKKRITVEDLSNKIDELNSRLDSVTEGEKSSLYFLIHNGCREAIDKGCIDEDSLEAITEAWSIYHGKLKGNGFLDVMMDKVKALPLSK